MSLTKTRSIYGPEWLERQFKPMVVAAVKKGVDPKNIYRFQEFLRNSRNMRINWGASTVADFAKWAGNEYEAFVDDILSDM